MTPKETKAITDLLTIGLILLIMLISWPINALILAWENYVFFQLPIAFWQFLVLAIPIVLFRKSLKLVLSALLIAAFIGQTIAWTSLAHLPLFPIPK